MAAMTTVLTEFSNKENSRTSSVAGHLASRPRLVIESRRVPSGNQVVMENTIRVSYGTVDADVQPIPERVSLSATMRFPIHGKTSDRDAALAVFRDIIAGDEFGDTFETQNWLKP